ncbi:MAG TPA: hypothetical protein PLU22_19145, partial [Polyangiaceae bacterium]|nr:hypothetical protein [Polyangiaceae bacterium]
MARAVIGARGWLLLGGVALFACGKTTDEPSASAEECAAGTVLVDGECVADGTSTGGEGGAAIGSAGDAGSNASQGGTSPGGTSGGHAGEGSGGALTGGTVTGGASSGGTTGGDAGEDSGGTGAAETGGTEPGSGGAGGALPLNPTDKVDLLLVIDNSISMADKQEILRDTLPELVEQLTNPGCVDGEGVVTPRPTAGEPCPAGTVDQLLPVLDLHMGVVTSSLGGHGGIACTPAEGSTWVPEKDDRAELIAPLRDVASFRDLGFLAWDATADPEPGATSDLATLAGDLDAIVAAAGETGCGYEAPLEAWYRFLVDPMPPLQVLNDG